MRLVYFGSGAFGLPTLSALAQRHEVAAVVTQPDKPAGRGHKLAPTPIAEWAAANLPQTPLLKPVKAGTPEDAQRIRAFRADAFVVIAFGQKLTPNLLDSTFAINLHASLLPRWRGAAPINAAILAGDTQTGNSVITLADRIDAGFILGQSARDLPPHLTAGELHDLLAADGPALVLDVLERHRSATLAPLAQDESAVTIAPKLSRKDAWADFAQPADRVRARIHAFNPWPAVTTILKDKPLKLLRAEAHPGDSQEPLTSAADRIGTLVDAQAGCIACAGGSLLRLLEVQPAGGKPMPWSAYARGHHPQPGDRFEKGPTPC